MIKRHVFSAVFLTASLFALSSCQFFFESVRDFTAEEVPENKSKNTPVPLPPATPTKTGCNFSNFQLFKQLDENNYTTQETVKYFIPDEDFSEDNI